MMKKAAWLAILLVFGSHITAQSIFGPGDPQVRSLAELFSLSGRVFPTSAFPVSREELADFAVRLLGAAPELSDSIESYLEELDYREGVPRGSITPGVEVKKYWYTEGAQGDFYRDFLEMPEFLSLEFDGEQNGSGGIYLKAGWKREYEPLPNANTFQDKGESNPLAGENMTLRQGYVYFTPENLTIVFGRTGLHYGSPLFSTFLPSDRLPFLDAFAWNYSIGRFTLSSYIASLENRKGIGETGMAGDTLDFGKNTILSTIHRFEYAWPSARFTVSGHSFIARENNMFYLADFFPVYSWHEGRVGSHNLSLVFDLELSLIPGLGLYLQAGFDEVNATDVTGVGDSGLPTIDAYLIGLAYARDIEDLFRLSATAEWGTTHYLWGNYWREDGYYGNYFQRAIYRVKTDSGIYIIPMTSPYGPGATWIAADIEAATGFGLTGNLRLLYLEKNTQANLVTTEHAPAEEEMAAAPISRELLIGLGAAYRFQDYLELSAEPVYHLKDGESWMELGLSARTWYDILVPRRSLR